MKKIGLKQHRQTERAIIDALLKISEIVQKTEANRKREKSAHISKRSKKPVGDGDYDELHANEQQVPIPPPMRTLDSYVSSFNQQSLQKPSNCNQASIRRSGQYVLSPSQNSSENSKQYDQQQRADDDDDEDQEYSCKRHCYGTSSISSLSNDHYRHRTKSSPHHSSHRPNNKPSSIYQEPARSANQPTTTTFSSQATTILDDQSSSLIMMPTASVSTIPPPVTIKLQSSMNPIPLHIEQQQFSSPSNILTNSKIDFDTFIDEQLQTTLEKRLRNPLLPTTSTTKENIQQQRKTRLSTLTKCETAKLIDELDFTKQVGNSEHYEKQRELAMLAAKQGNYSLSYSIYTNLLHDNHYDYKLKSEILASRATTLLLEEKCFESIDDCTQAVAFNEWNKLAYVIRAACWMIKQEYLKAVEDYSKLFHFFDQSQHVLDLLNLAYEKFKLLNSNNNDDEQLIKNSKNEINITEQPMVSINPTQSFSLASPTTSSINKRSQSDLIWIKNPYRSF